MHATTVLRADVLGRHDMMVGHLPHYYLVYRLRHDVYHQEPPVRGVMVENVVVQPWRILISPPEVLEVDSTSFPSTPPSSPPIPPKPTRPTP